MKRIWLILGCLLLVGCGEQRPNIPNYHWRGSQLYDKNGVNVASVVTMPSYLDSSQACIFVGPETDCTYWETGQQAYDHVKEVFKHYEVAR